jgi:hypothetical protein
MGLDSLYIYASSNESKDRHPYNQVTDFVVELPVEVDLNGAWEVGLLEAYLDMTTSINYLYLCCDFLPRIDIVRKTGSGP